MSSAGQYRATLKQIASFPCRQYIRMEPTPRGGEKAAAQLHGLELTVRVLDAAGVECMAGTFPPPPVGRYAGDGVTIADGAPMPIGEYSVVFDVVTPVPALAGRPVRVVSGYVLCGIEWMSASVSIAIGVAGVAIGAGVCGVLWVTRRRSPVGAPVA